MVVNFKRTHLISWAPSSPPSASFFTPSLSCGMSYMSYMMVLRSQNKISMWGFALSNLVHIPQHGDPSKHRGNSPRQNLSRTLPDIKSKSNLIKPDIWTWATSFAISLFTFSPKIEPTASSPAMIVCREWTWKSLIFLAEIQTCPGVAPFTTSIRPFAPEASPPTVKTTPATFWEDTIGSKFLYSRCPDLKREIVGFFSCDKPFGHGCRSSLLPPQWRVLSWQQSQPCWGGFYQVSQLCQGG